MLAEGGRMTASAAGRDHPVPAQPPSPPAEASPPGGPARRERGPVRASTVLADRMAAALVHREPGWRLPRRTALARRYNVSLTEIDAALGDLARRSLVRRLPDGQLYRASPADYWIPVEGAGGLGTRLDPMGGTIACQTRHVSTREAPQDVAWALQLPSRRADPRGPVRLGVRGRPGRRVHRLPERAARPKRAPSQVRRRIRRPPRSARC